MPNRPIRPAKVSVRPVSADTNTVLTALLKPGFPSHSRATWAAVMGTAWSSARSLAWLHGAGRAEKCVPSGLATLPWPPPSLRAPTLVIGAPTVPVRCQVLPPSAVPMTSEHVFGPHGAAPSTHPCWASRKVTELALNPAGTGAPGPPDAAR